MSSSVWRSWAVSPHLQVAVLDIIKEKVISLDYPVKICIAARDLRTEQPKYLFRQLSLADSDHWSVSRLWQVLCIIQVLHLDFIFNPPVLIVF